MLAGKTILLFGGMGLLGKRIVTALLDVGANVIIASRSADVSAFQFTGECCQKSVNLSAVSVDVSKPSEVEAALEFAVQKHGVLSAVVNLSFPRNVAFGNKFEDVRYEEFCDNLVAHLGGAFLVCQKAVEVFRRQGGGHIVNVASIYGVVAPRFHIYDGTSMTKEVEYVLAKSAIVHLTKYLARYLKGKNIRVNCISPGGISDSQPQAFLRGYNSFCVNKGMLDPEDLVGTFLFLLSDQSKFINGQNIIVDDGFSL